MAGSYNKRDGFVYMFKKPSKEDAFYTTMFEVMFDEQCDEDAAEIAADIEEAKLFKKVCWLKTLIFPLEYPLAYIIMGKQWAKDKVEAQKFYWKFIRNKITLQDMKVEVAKLIRE